MLRAYAADDLGLVKVIEAPQNQPIDTSRVVASWGEPSRAAGVTCLSTHGSAYLAAARPNSIDMLDLVSGSQLGSLPFASTVAGVSLLATSAERPASMLSCTGDGSLRVHNIQHEEAACTFDEQASWQAQSNIECMAINEASTQAALACHGSELGIWDLQQQQRSYHAKGGKPNKLRLVDKPHNTAVAFLPDSNSQRVVVGTAYHKLRLYDIKSRRPALEMEFGEARVTAVAPERNGTSIWLANGMGKIECLDLRMNKLHSALKGPAGAVKSLALHPELPVIASVGLDRFFRLHNTSSRKVLCKVYLKQQSTAVAWGEIPPHAQLHTQPVQVAEEAKPVSSDSIDATVAPKKSKARQSKTKADKPHKKRKQS